VNPPGPPGDLLRDFRPSPGVLAKQFPLVSFADYNILCNTPTQNLLAMFAALGRNL